MAKETRTNKGKEEFGKWIMDVAKYLTTAIVITTIIGNVENEAMLLAVSTVAITALMIFGVTLVNSSSKPKTNKRK